MTKSLRLVTRKVTALRCRLDMLAHDIAEDTRYAVIREELAIATRWLGRVAADLDEYRRTDIELAMQRRQRRQSKGGQAHDRPRRGQPHSRAAGDAGV